MKIKRNSAIIILVVAVYLCLISIILAVVPKDTTTVTTASASTSTGYAVTFDYENSYYSRSSYGNSERTIKTGKDVVSAEVEYNTGGKKTSFSISLYGSIASASGVLQKDGFVTSESVRIEVNSQFPSACYMEVKHDASSTMLTSTDNKYTLNDLTDGTYNIRLGCSKSTSTAVNVSAGYSMMCKFSFIVDRYAPSITGATDSQTGKYTNTAFTVSANDSGSGVETIYMQAPDSSVYKSVGASTTISNGSANGLYRFYAVDYANNKTQTYYVNFDDTAPKITCSGASFGTNTNSSFTVSATDNSGSATLYYKVERGTWQACGSSYTVSGSAEDSTYYFYAIDSYGNRSDEEWVMLGAELSGRFVKSERDNSVYFTWDRPSWTATLDGVSYRKGAWIREEGDHTIKLSSQTKSAVYPYTIDHYYVETVEKPTCTTEGFMQYDCLQCGKSYTNYAIEETGHYYVASTTVATCTTGGYTVYTCTRCGDSYTDNFTNPLGHNYESAYQPANCTEYGKTVFTCQVCGDGYYETDGTYPSGHNYTNTVIKDPTCTQDGIMQCTCDICGDSYEEIIAANGHSYGISEIQTSEGKTTRIYTCKTCGATYKQELGDQYAEVSNYVEYLFEQYSPYMWWVFLAAAGIWSIVIGVMIAIAQKHEEKEKAKKMLINYVIGLVVIAVIVIACPLLIRGIAALVT